MKKDYEKIGRKKDFGKNVTKKDSKKLSSTAFVDFILASTFQPKAVAEVLSEE